MNETFKYYAFISYSHADKKIAKKLQQKLEHYHLPAELQKSCPNLPENLNPIFMDESNLVARGSLKIALQENLARSNYLIVICSPNSARSEYVNDEVEYFIKLGRKNHIIPLIIDGVPHANNESECFPLAILELSKKDEPTLVDMKEYGVRDSFLRVIAIMLGLDSESFVSREHRERRQKTIIFSLIATVVVIIMIALIQYNIDLLNEMFYNDEAQVKIAANYYNKQEYVKAFEWSLKAAEQGNIVAQAAIGGMYYEGKGVIQDYAKAFEWLMKAVENGNNNNLVQNFLGNLYRDGNGAARNYAKAFECYMKAANDNNFDAQSSLGDMYYYGRYVTQDYAKAMEWYLKAANNGNSNAQKNIALMYHDGLGVQQDYHKAMEWYLKASNNGNSVAQNNIGYLYEKGSGVPQDYNKAMEWYLKAADKGNAFSQYSIGIMYRDGLGIPKNNDKAIEWLQKAADQGDNDAKLRLKELSPNE